MKTRRRHRKELSSELSMIDMTAEPAKVNLSFTEKQLPQHIRTKHVHGLHPYLGKFIPQLVEYFLAKFFDSGDLIVDPFVGSGTTLVEASIRNINSIGVDISEFNCLMSRVKTQQFDMALLSRELSDAVSKLVAFAKQQSHDYIPLTRFYSGEPEEPDVNYESVPESFSRWYSKKSLDDFLYFRRILPGYTYTGALKILLSRCARSARQVFHFELDHPKDSVKEPYYCFKHSRICTPCMDAQPFFVRYSKDIIKRIGQFQKIRGKASVDVIHGDSRVVDLPDNISGVFTSPPYLGLIDYHEQHSYAFDLLELKNRDEEEIGSKSLGKNGTARNQYIQGIADVLLNLSDKLADNADIFIVVNDDLGLYEQIARKAEMKIVRRIPRKVNRRTGIRGAAYSEEILHLKP